LTAAPFAKDRLHLSNRAIASPIQQQQVAAQKEKDHTRIGGWKKVLGRLLGYFKRCDPTTTAAATRLEQQRSRLLCFSSRYRAVQQHPLRPCDATSLRPSV